MPVYLKDGSVYDHSFDYMDDPNILEFKMPIKYEIPKDAIYTGTDTLVEQEHKDSCDINKMMINIHNGYGVRMGEPGVYGYDDLTIDAVQHRINLEKAKELHEELSEFSKSNEVDEEIYEQFPSQVRESIKLRKKSKAVKNDDKTTTTQAATTSANTPPVT